MHGTHKTQSHVVDGLGEFSFDLLHVINFRKFQMDNTMHGDHCICIIWVM